MRSLTYLAAFEPGDNENDKSYSVFFPDLPGCVSVGDNFEDARRNAEEALGLHIYGMEKDGDTIPSPSEFNQIAREDVEGCVICPIVVYPDIVKNEADSRAVKTNTTIPSWLKDLAEARGINYSQVLQTALIEILGVKR